MNFTANVRPRVRFRLPRQVVSARALCSVPDGNRELCAALLPLRFADEGSFRAMPTDDILRSSMMYFVLPEGRAA